MVQITLILDVAELVVLILKMVSFLTTFLCFYITYIYTTMLSSNIMDVFVDSSSEQRSRDKFYVPRDEECSEVKELYFNKGRDSKDTNLLGKDSFSNLSQIESMFRDGIEAPSATPNILQLDISSMVSPDQPDYYSSDVLNANNRFPIPESYRSE